MSAININNVWTNLLDNQTGESVNFEEVTTWVDGTPMDDTKADGVVYRKLPASVGGGYVRRIVVDGRFNVRWFGAAGDGSTDDTAPIQLAVDIVSSINNSDTRGPNITLLIPDDGVFVTTDTINIPPNLNVDMAGKLYYGGVQDRPAVIVGTPGVAGRNSELTLNVANVPRNANWSNSNHVGVRIYNSTSSTINVTLIDGFSMGLECVGDAAGFAYNQVHINSLASNGIGLYLDYRNGGWCNENVFYGGRFSVQQGYNSGVSRLGARLTGDDNRLIYPSFELNRQTASPGFAQAAIFEDAYNCEIVSCRNEGNSNLTQAPQAPSFVMNGDTKNCRISVAYTFNRQRGREVNAFQDNSDTKQNVYFSIENEFTDAMRGRPIFDSGAIGDKFVPYSSTQGYLPNLLFTSHDTGSTNYFTPASLNARVVNRGGGNEVELLSTAFTIKINTEQSKKFCVVRSGHPFRAGRVGIRCYDAAGNNITSEVDWLLDGQSSDGHASEIFAWSSNYGGCYLTGTPTPINIPVYFSVKPQVASIDLLIGSPGSLVSLSSFQVYNLDNAAHGITSRTSVFQADGLRRTNNQGAPSRGTYTTGEILFERNPSTGVPLLRVCSASGTSTVIAATGDYVAGNVIENVSDTTQFQVGDFIEIDTFSGQQYFVTAIDAGASTITLNTSSGAVAGTGLNITNKAPEWRTAIYLDGTYAGAGLPTLTPGRSGTIYQRLGTGLNSNPVYVSTGPTSADWKYLLTEDDRVSEASGDTAGAPGGTYSQAEVQAILDELRDLKTKMRAAGLLDT